MMAPYMDQLMQAQVQAKRNVDQATRIHNFLASLQYAKIRAQDKKKAAAMLEELARIEGEWIAFRGDADQWDKVRACDYHDQWLGIMPPLRVCHSGYVHLQQREDRLPMCSSSQKLAP